MKLELKDFQSECVDNLAVKLRQAIQYATPASPHAVVLSAPTGSGKTVIATELIERVLEGDDQSDPDPDSVFLWITDLPELNRQTYDKMLAMSDVLSLMSMQIIDSSFNQRTFLSGKVYFINTQKLGHDKLLTNLGDGRQYTIWQTIDNSIAEMGGRLNVIIDEAHRGMRTQADETEAATIIQKLLKGTDVLRPVPVVIGISPTPQRFNDLLATCNHTVHKCIVDAADVRASGLLKDRIILHHKKDNQMIDITMLRLAVKHWVLQTKRWETYCNSEEEKTVVPILVVQLENAPTDKPGTRTDLGVAIEAVNDSLSEPLPLEAFAHSFDEGTSINVGGRAIRYLAPSRISRDQSVRVIFFKTALSTGWDCPQAETMMSYRVAKDATYIAQLVGRMVRTPLARRIIKDETLNSVALFLPHYDKSGVKAIVEKLTDPNHDFVPPVEVEGEGQSVTLIRAGQSEELFSALSAIPSFMVPTKRRVRQTRRVMQLARALERDNIFDGAILESETRICQLLDTQMESYRSQADFRDQVIGKSQVTIGALTFDVVKQMYVEHSDSQVAVSPENIDDLFDEANRRLGEGLAIDYWKRNVSGTEDQSAIRHAKIEISILLSYSEVLTAVERLGEDLVDEWRGKFVAEIDALPESRRATYDEIVGSASKPTEVHIRYPHRISWSLPESQMKIAKHLFVNEQGHFADDLNALERETIAAELPSALGWLRNPDRKRWSFAIPYERTPGVIKPLYPDFLFIRSEDGTLAVDIIDPHSVHLDDAVSKAKGLALFAKSHGHRFGRIEIVDKPNARLCRLNLKDRRIRNQVLAITNNDGLRALYLASDS